MLRGRFGCQFNSDKPVGLAAVVKDVVTSSLCPVHQYCTRVRMYLSHLAEHSTGPGGRGRDDTSSRLTIDKQFGGSLNDQNHQRCAVLGSWPHLHNLCGTQRCVIFVRPVASPPEMVHTLSITGGVLSVLSVPPEQLCSSREIARSSRKPLDASWFSCMVL